MARNPSEIQSESFTQIQFVAWMRKTYPQHRIFAIPNGGGRSRADGLKLKNEGVSPGVPDLFIPSLLLWIEMKSATGRASRAQKSWLNYLDGIGHNTAICRTLAEAQDAVLQIIEKENN